MHVRLGRFLESRPWVGSLLLASPLLLLALVTWGRNRPEFGMLGADVSWPLMLVLDLIAIGALVISRIRPGTALAAAGTACTLQILLLQGPGWASLAVPAVVYACAKYGSRRISLLSLWWGLAGALLAGAFLVGSYVVLWSRDEFGPVVQEPGGLGTAMPFVVMIGTLLTGFCASVVVGAWTLGDLGGRRRREQAATNEKNRLLEVEREQEARLAADAERMRIAREMHDVVSHSMSVMIAQSDGGRYVLRNDAEQAEQAFEAIGRTGREALSELRSMLGVLREGSEDLQRRPAPSLDQLPQLLDDIRASGLEVRVMSAPEHLPILSEGAGLAVYRIIQEALTNTLKHGGPDAGAELRVTVEHTASEATPELVVDVRDDGAGADAPSDGSGSGILGMSERARLYGGVLNASAEQGGYRLTARFPLRKVVAGGSQPAPKRGA